MATYVLEEIGGSFPTQATGRTVGDRPFYFRARHGSWTLELGETGWPTDYVDWPTDRWPPGELLAEGDDESHGCMARADVERILEQHLVGR